MHVPGRCTTRASVEHLRLSHEERHQIAASETLRIDAPQYQRPDWLNELERRLLRPDPARGRFIQVDPARLRQPPRSAFDSGHEGLAAPLEGLNSGFDQSVAAWPRGSSKQHGVLLLASSREIE